MKRNILFVLGLLLTLSGFLLAHEKEIPFVSALIYKNVNALRTGFNEVCGLPIGLEDVSNRYRSVVRGDLTLLPIEKGFIELSEFIKRDLRKDKSEYFAQTGDGMMSFDDFKKGALTKGFSKMTFQGIPGNGTGINIPIGNNQINVFLTDASSAYGSFFVYKISEGIDKEHRSISFVWALVLFLCGFFLQIFQFSWAKRKA